jgi:3-isopropylmalate/(R)-2-methylmalate dehydratase small subunit
MDKTFSGRVWKFGDDIDTDLIIPGFALWLPKADQLKACMSANRPGWSDLVEPGDVLLAGTNFGVGSGRWIGDTFRWLGIIGIIAESFNGLGMRNCINVGLPLLPCVGILDAFEEGDVVEADWGDGRVVNASKGTSLTGQPVPGALQEIIAGGGVEQMLRKEGFLSGEGNRMPHERI